ncbi:cytochrome P450 [Rhodococcus sp. NPDC058514]|uniref:cytochrome P450 n=1 Tax=unclassified Rhodococcus (in: high G+C Gram-positive bacteria) TaxID=192944 RepID=UPI003667D393
MASQPGRPVAPQAQPPGLDLPTGFDFTDPDLYVTGVPHAEFAALRKHCPVWWNPQPPGVGGFRDEGYWVITRHADIREVSRDSALFSSWLGGALVRLKDDIDQETFEMQRLIMLNKDAPEHTTLRKLVARGFTPRAIANLRQKLADRAEQIVAAAAESGSGDFVTQIASELPLQAIAELIGVPPQDRRQLFDWSNEMTGSDDPEYDVDPLVATSEVLAYAYRMADERRSCPADDIVTTLIQADIDGDELSPEEFGFFVILLAVAGNETTRNAITHGMIAFLENPDQWELFKRERPATTADEIVRWATPVTAFQRTATADTVLGGQQIRKGDRVAMFYASANFDEDVFDDPTRFDITRDPNPHLGFGGSGAHYCLGASLALLEIDLIFNALADRIPDITRLGDPQRLRSGWLNGIKRFDVGYGGGCPVTH